MINGIKAVLLDVDNTLLDFNLSAEESIKKSFSELGLKFTDEVMTTFLRINDGLWRAIERKEITREELHSVRWRIIFGELETGADGAEMERLFLDNLENCAIPVTGAIELVKYLSAKYPLYTASNAPYLQQVNRLTISGIMPFITAILNFESQGVHKPQQEFFKQCLAAMSPVKSDEIAIIGDSVTADMQGGKGVGFTTVWFNPRGEKSPANVCDFTVNSLSEIKNLL